jgi:ubiquinone/menaquinone biosynthesis C-methylase UbiE
VEDKDKFIEEIKRILKIGGRVLFIDWLDGSIITGSNHKNTISIEKVKGIFKEKGFILDKEINAGAHHYGMIFRKE